MTTPTPDGFIRIWDQFGQFYDIDNKNKLWDEALKRSKAGEKRIDFPMAQITDAMEWGWWSCFNTQQKWLESCGVPFPNHKTLFGLEDASDYQLRKMLQEFGGHVMWLEANIGVMEGRLSALKSGYAAAVLVASGKSDDKKATGKSKEAEAIAGSETLRQTKRMQIEQETVLETAKGMLEGYKKAWETVSRVITSVVAERDMTTSRHP